MDKDVQNLNQQTINVPLLDINGENAEFRNELSGIFDQTLRSGRFVLGPEVQALEEEVAEFVGADFGVGCASGSDALLLALMACDIGCGDEVIVPSFTFFATASSVSRLGAKPVYADIDPHSYLLTAESIAARITPRTKAIIPVHLFGQAVDWEPIQALAQQHNLHLIEDAAQAIGAKYGQKGVGSLGDMGCFSFYPTKNLGGFGDGGMITTNDPALADRLQLLRGHGMRPRYVHNEIGINSRLDALQASMLRTKLPHLAEWNQRRSDNARRYTELFAASNCAASIQWPTAESLERHVWNQFTIRVKSSETQTRDQLREFLTARGIGTEIYYPIPLHEQECFQHLGYRAEDLPVTSQAAREVLSLPIHPRLTEEQQAYVVKTVADYIAPRTAIAA